MMDLEGTALFTKEEMLAAINGINTRLGW